MKRSIKFLVLAIVMAALMAFLASPALAINDPLVPGNDCSAGTPSEAVGEPAAGGVDSPAETHGLAQPKNPINPPVSLTKEEEGEPGNAPGAQAPVPDACV